MHSLHELSSPIVSFCIWALGVVAGFAAFALSVRRRGLDATVADCVTMAQIIFGKNSTVSPARQAVTGLACLLLLWSSFFFVPLGA